MNIVGLLQENGQNVLGKHFEFKIDFVRRIKNVMFLTKGQ